MGLPASGYSWPQFEEGNTAAVSHGAYSPRHVDPVSEQIVNVALTLVPYLADPSYAPALWRYARAEAKAALVEKWLTEKGQLDDKGEPRPAAEFLRKLEKDAAEFARDLGMTPSSRARIQKELLEAARADFDLARLQDQGRDALASRKP